MKASYSALIAAALACAASFPAAAHTRVVASTPAQGAHVAAPRTVSLSFSEPLLVPTAAIAVVMTAMPGMPDHGDMFIRNFTQTWSDNNRKLTLTLRKPLQTGTYDVRWQAAGADGHRMSGKVTFTVK
ncbi:MAG: copper resistance protein CopC [Sphingomonadaceae bacterium]|jgi:copper resistance protein C|nr:copper resistance protein CopC [Sphingomonadaceae bacterium]NBU79644.1 copper resistance protein CopC [Sphingomonadaceae bacterium]NCA02149.1 copper resistance protein CopC [Sphingomonadaceae bacterium]